MGADNDKQEEPASGTVVKARTSNFVLVGESVALTIEGPTRVEVRDFKGRSEGHRNDDGTFELRIRDCPPRGTGNEPLVRRVLANALQIHTGVATDIQSGRDEWGEDGIVHFDGAELTLQIVTVPSNPGLGKAVHEGSAILRFTAEQGAQWIVEAIGLKALRTPLADRRRTLLALDARQAGVLANDAIMEAFGRLVPTPEQYQFARIWLVGPTSGTCRRLC